MKVLIRNSSNSKPSNKRIALVQKPPEVQARAVFYWPMIAPVR